MCCEKILAALKELSLTDDGDLNLRLLTHAGSQLRNSCVKLDKGNTPLSHSAGIGRSYGETEYLKGEWLKDLVLRKNYWVMIIMKL